MEGGAAGPEGAAVGLVGSVGAVGAAGQGGSLQALASAFRRALPLLCSPTAFMEGLETSEESELLAALRGEFDMEGGWRVGCGAG